MGKLYILTENKLAKLIKSEVAKALEQENRDYEREILLKQAYLATLQSQINPHFLYNTLECIRGMALVEGQTDIADIALSLSLFFRYSISGGSSNIVTLKDELLNVSHYAKIQNYRFKNRFQIEIMEDFQIEDATLPKLILQPIVENAILHGFTNRMEGAVVTVSVRRIDEDILITVSDNGCGMPPDALRRLMDKINSDEPASGEVNQHTGVGLGNVNRRIKLHFGPQYGVTIYSCPDVGTDVELRIPYRR